MTPLPPDPMMMIQCAIDKGMDIEKLERLFDLQKQWVKDRAAEQYAASLTAFQSECPTVFKSQQADRYKFASYEDVMAEAAPVLARHKIVVGFSTEQDNGMLKTICRVRVGTHFEDHTFTVPIPAEMKVNDTQKFGAALKYAQRYALCAALNIVVTREDNDAAHVTDLASVDDLAEIDSLMTKKRVGIVPFLKWASDAAGFAVESIDQLPAKVAPKALDFLRRKADPQ